MKKIGKNGKLYLLGMLIGGIGFGLTTVVADTIINSTSVAYKTTTVKAALDNLYDVADFKEMLYPVGSIYISVDSTNPSELFGGTWETFGEGRTLLGTGSVTANTTTSFGTVTAGSFNHQSAEVKGGEYNHTLTIAEMPSHTHQIIAGTAGHKISTSFSTNPNNTSATFRFIPDADNTTSAYGGNWYADNTGGGSQHNNVQPYITVYMWKRTA